MRKRGTNYKQAYISRLITCPVCKEQVETARMQLFTPLGFRYVSCSGCAKQRWARGWLCECGVAWHTCAIHRRDPGVPRSTKPPKKSEVQGKVESCFKDSERKAPEAVQSASNRPLKKVKANTVLHAHGGEAKSEEAATLRKMKLIERWRNMFVDNEVRRSNESKQSETARGEEETQSRARASFHSQVDQVPRGFKRQSHEMESDGSVSRKRLRELLNEQVEESRRTQVRRLDPMIQQKMHPTDEQAKPKKFRMHGNDAITTLINAGRQRQGRDQDATIGEVEKENRLMIMGACSQHVTKGVVAWSP